MICRSKAIPLLISTVLMAAAAPALAYTDPVGSLADDARVGRFSGVLGVADHGGARIVDARGSADVDGHIANDLGVAYPLGSVTKALTATAIMRLVEEGRIDLAASADAYLPEYADRAFAKVTIAQLLSHTSGVPSLLRTDQGLGDEPPDFDILSLTTSTTALIDQFSAAPLLFEPGARYSYSNSGYILLGRIIEVVTGQPYYAALDMLVLAPARVSDAFCLCRDLPDAPDATAFERQGDGFTPAPVIDPSHTFSAGGLRATPDGLLKWSEALMSGRILSPETLERMWTPMVETRNPGEFFALGWLVREVDGVRQVAHDGALPGAVSYLVLNPADHRATFGALNRTLDLDNLSSSESYLRQVVSSVVAGRDLTTVPVLASPMAAEALVGTYRLPQDRTFTLQIDSQDQLWLETDGHWSVLQLPKLALAGGPLAAAAEAAITAWITSGQTGLAPYFSPDMANLPAGTLDGVWSQFIDQFGAYRRHHVYAVTGDFAEVRIDFAGGSMDIGIVYDAEGRINGLQPVGQEIDMPVTRVRAWVTTDGGLWIDGYAHAGPDVAATPDGDGGLNFQSGQNAIRTMVR